MTFNIITFGCKVNSYESEYIKEQMLNNQYTFIDEHETSDIVIVNTCSVTNIADNKCQKMIRSIRRENPSAILVVCGCSAENLRDIYNNMDIDILIGNTKKSEIVSLINNYIKTNHEYHFFSNEEKKSFENMSVTNYSNLTRAFVKIEDGCENFCAFCIIPYVRGNIRSKDMSDIIKEVNDLVAHGHKEIVLTGINTGAYGKDKGYDLTDLIKELSKINNLERIRISSIEMTEINDKFISEYKNNHKICPHLHVSLQSGSAKILKLMNRKYTKESYLDNIRKIIASRPDTNLTTDVIVGFPGETEDDFQECINFCKEVGFSKIHVFPYSKREGTVASTMNNQIPNEIKKERARRLINIDQELELSFNKKYLNQEINVLIEETKNGKSYGHTNNFIKVEIAEKLEKNQNYKIKVIEAYPLYVIGKIVK